MAENNKNSQYTFYDKDNGYLSCDYDFKTYANEIISLIGKVDFLLISQYPEVLNVLHQKRVPYIVVAPNNSSYLSSSMRKIIKQQWFGRFCLRESSIDWINLLLKLPTPKSYENPVIKGKNRKKIWHRSPKCGIIELNKQTTRRTMPCQLYHRKSLKVKREKAEYIIFSNNLKSENS